jgi:hypothetical protein
MLLVMTQHASFSEIIREQHRDRVLKLMAVDVIRPTNNDVVNFLTTAASVHCYCSVNDGDQEE